MDLNRRNFLLGSAAAATLAGCATNKMGLRALKPGEKRNVALIGCGRQMHGLMHQFARQPNVRIDAVCDCDRTRLDKMAKSVESTCKITGVRKFADFRDILKDPTIDMVCIATPDHWHAYISVEAMKHGKDVYCEKPLTFSIDEAKKVMAAQKKYGRVFQTGSMQRSWAEVNEFRTACMIVRNGLIGDIKYVDANYGKGGQKLGGPSHPIRFWDEPDLIDKATPNRDMAPNSRLTAESNGKVFKESDPNPDVDWNMWLGPAKWRPYSDQLAPRGVHKFYPMYWRFDDDIGSGYNGDWGAHHLDIAQWGMDMDSSGPYRIIRSDEPYSKNPLHGGRRQFGMKMLFKKPYGDIELYHGPFGVWGTVFYGTKGIVAVSRGKIGVWYNTGLVKPNEEIRNKLQKLTFMKDKMIDAWIVRDYGTDAKKKKDQGLNKVVAHLTEFFKLDTAPVQLYKTPNQVQNFCECVESRKLTISPAEVGGRSATLCLLCNLSYIYDTGFDWDPIKMEIVGANPKGISIKREVYRNGWDIVV